MKRRRGQKSAPLRSLERLEDRLLLTAVPEVEPNDSSGDLAATAPLSITPNTASFVSGEINQLGDVDLYKVDLLAGETLTADIDTPAPHSLNSFLRVFDSSGTEYTAGIGSPTNDDDGVSTDSKVQIQILTGGTYYIGVSDNTFSFYDANDTNDTNSLLGPIFGSSIGSYQLNVLVSTPTSESEPNDVKSQANVPIVMPGTPTILSGTIDPAGDVDLYKVHLNFGDTLTADIDAATTGSSLDSYLRVFDSAGVEVANNDNDGSTTDSLISFQAQADGDYYVGVSDFVNSQYSIDNTDNRFGVFTGDYQLKLTIDAVPDAGDTLGTATTLSLDPLTAKTLPGTIDSPGDADLYQVTMNAGDTLDVKV
ncbi:MAG TPA: PPC domain-containing protein, partial [Pirellulales bacterium]